MTVTVNCSVCGQSFQMDVDDEGYRLPVCQNLLKIVRCNECADKEKSKKRSEWFARKQVAKSETEPF